MPKTNSKSIVVPTASLAKLVYRAVKLGRLPYNYCCAARDVSGGIWLQLANADWLPPGQTYVNPHTR